jgi:sucrose phosphorylase
MAVHTPNRPWKRITYLPDPDFTRPRYTLPPEPKRRMRERLSLLYGAETAERWMPELERLIAVHQAHKTQEHLTEDKRAGQAPRFRARDMVLITYGDAIKSERRTGLAAFGEFLAMVRRQDPIFNVVHILPFFPSSSDRGFAIVDFTTVDPNLGTWDDIEAIGRDRKLMFDAVCNHASSGSPYFREMLSGNPDYKDFAITFRSPDELTPEQRKLIRRPRTSDILSRFDSVDGPVWCWTTFSPDQIDLNFRNPKVLMGAIQVLLLYVRRGADLIRLDAVTYLWDEPGTEGASLAQTHEIVKLFRDVLDLCAPAAIILTETNVPHQENISYFGNGRDEAQMVYNFALPPLVLHAFYRQDTRWLTKWARDLIYPSDRTTYLNMLDTHDGIGLPGVTNILPPEEIDFLIQRAREHGAFVSLRSSPDGGGTPYEINSTWYSALNMDNSGEPRKLQVDRFTASRSIALALKGVPAIYFHGLIGSRNDVELALRSKSKRDVNRASVSEATLLKLAQEPGSKFNLILGTLVPLLEKRVRRAAFDPRGVQKVLDLNPGAFAVLRTSPDGADHILAITNVQPREWSLEVPLEELGMGEPPRQWYDLVDGRGWLASGGALCLTLQPYDVLWLTPSAELERAIEAPG